LGNEAASTLAGMIKDATAIYYSQDASTLRSRLQDFRSRWGATVSTLLGPGVTLDDAWDFALQTERAVPGVLSTRLVDLAGFIGSNSYDQVLAEFSNILRDAATSFPSSFRSSIEGLNWSVARLVDVKDALRDAVPHGKKAEQALIKGYIRSVTVPQQDTSIPLYSGSSKVYNLKVQGPGSQQTYNVPGSVLQWTSSDTNVAAFDDPNSPNKLRAKTVASTTTVTVRAFHPGNMAPDAWLAQFDITIKPPLSTGTTPVDLSGLLPVVDRPLPEDVTLTFGSEGSIQLTLPKNTTVPAGAKIVVNTPQPAQYQATIPTGMEMAGQLVDLSISGWTPEPGTTLTIALKVTGGKTKVAVFYYNETTGRWEYQDSWVEGDNVRANITHTSIYAVLEDVTPPDNVTLTAGDVTSSSIVLNFSATDSSGIKGYDIYRNGTKIKSLFVGNSYTDTGLSAGTTYTYKVTASGMRIKPSGPIIPSPGPRWRPCWTTALP
ncbi:MAG: fibronectin type III domain-containing protein, partial [Moorella sp. (in: Bacteria)]|nr:fibronectin type III domain-containing protein [Moorella sp. (in: firmicutes)]